MKTPKTVSQANLTGRTVILRLDLDVPLDSQGQVSDESRLIASLDTIRFCQEHATKTLIIGHLGRPVEKDLKYSLKPVANILKGLINQDFKLLNNFDEADEWLKSDSSLGMLENLRFWPGEDQNQPHFTSRLASLGDIYINDAFAVSHRSSASVVGLPRLLPSFMGNQLGREVAAFKKVLDKPKRPIIMILGGIKADKIEFVDNFVSLVDKLLIGGRLVEYSPENPKIINADLIPNKLDISAKSIAIFRAQIASAGTIIWNGPLGKFEDPKYSIGTHLLAEAISKSKAYAIIGGGDTVAAIHSFGLKEDQFSHVSLGGGAMLFYLAHKTLPGLEAMAKSPKNS